MAKYTSNLLVEKFRHDEVMEVIEDTLIIRYSDNPINIAEALVMAAIDERIDLDGVYFLLRREPDVIQKLLSSTHVAAAGTMDSSTNKANRCDSQKQKRKRGT
jgi:hypothetical protein